MAVRAIALAAAAVKAIAAAARVEILAATLAATPVAMLAARANVIGMAACILHVTTFPAAGAGKILKAVPAAEPAIATTVTAALPVIKRSNRLQLHG